MQLKFAVYNIHQGKGSDNIGNFERVADTLFSFHADVIALSEVITRTSTENKRNLPFSDGQAKRLANALTNRDGDVWSYVAASESKTNRNISNVILTKLPIRASESIFIDRWGSCAHAKVEAWGGMEINCFATHLWWLLKDIKPRLTQIKNLLTYIETFNSPCIVGGDFNFRPDTKEYLTITAKLTDAWETARAKNQAYSYKDNPVSRHTFTRLRRIDHIYYQPERLSLARMECLDTRDLMNKNVVIKIRNSNDKGVRPSDHNPIIATFNNLQ